MAEYIVKESSTDRWKDYKTIILDQLKTNPRAFAKSYNTEVRKKDIGWRKELQDKNTAVLVAVCDDLIIGMTKIEFQTEPNKRHIAEIHGVYVDKKHRGKGLGKALLEEVIKRVKKRKEIKKIELKVNLQQKPAIKLYKKLGFKVMGELNKELKVKGRYYNEFIMEYLIQ